MLADRLALLKPAIEDIQAAGHTSLNAIAQELGVREIGAPRGGTWSATQVSRVLQRLGGG
jgi:hypothetical protein